MLEKALGHAGAHRVQIRTDVIDKCDVCRVDVSASTCPIWAKAQDVKVFFERRKNSTPGRVIPSDEVQALSRSGSTLRVLRRPVSGADQWNSAGSSVLISEWCGRRRGPFSDALAACQRAKTGGK